MKPEVKTTEEIVTKFGLGIYPRERKWIALDDVKEVLNEFWNDVWNYEVSIKGEIESNSFIRTENLTKLYWNLRKKLGLK